MKSNNLYLGDCLDLLAKIEDQTIDLVFLDPPYRRSLGEVAIKSALNSNWISKNALIILEEGEQKNSLEGFRLEDIRRYSDTILHFFRRV